MCKSQAAARGDDDDFLPAVRTEPSSERPTSTEKKSTVSFSLKPTKAESKVQNDDDEMAKSSAEEKTIYEQRDRVIRGRIVGAAKGASA